MLDVIKVILSLLFKLILFLIVFTLYYYFLIEIVIRFNFKAYISIDSIVAFIIILSMILSFGTFNFCKSFFRKMQEER